MVSKEVVRFPSKAAYRGTCFFVSEVPIQLPTFVAINEGCVCTCESLMESVWCVGHRSKQDTSSFSLTADLATPVTMQESSLVMRRGVPDLLGGGGIQGGCLHQGVCQCGVLPVANLGRVTVCARNGT